MQGPHPAPEAGRDSGQLGLIVFQHGAAADNLRQVVLADDRGAQADELFLIRSERDQSASGRSLRRFFAGGGFRSFLDGLEFRSAQGAFAGMIKDEIRVFGAGVGRGGGGRRTCGRVGRGGFWGGNSGSVRLDRHQFHPANRTITWSVTGVGGMHWAMELRRLLGSGGGPALIRLRFLTSCHQEPKQQRWQTEAQKNTPPCPPQIPLDWRRLGKVCSSVNHK